MELSLVGKEEDRASYRSHGAVEGSVEVVGRVKDTFCPSVSIFSNGFFTLHLDH